MKELMLRKKLASLRVRELADVALDRDASMMNSGICTA